MARADEVSQIKARLKEYVEGQGRSPQTVNFLIDVSENAYRYYKDRELCLMATSMAKEMLKSIIEEAFEAPFDIVMRKVGHLPNELIDLWWEILRHETPYLFESHILYMERKREYAKKFYEPRRQTLKVVVEDLQRLDDDPNIKFYGLSMPSRVGKSTICLFFLTWVACKKPNSHNAMGGHAGTLVKGFYKELLNFIVSEEYTFVDIFAYQHPNRVCLRDKSAEDYTITLDRPDRFATLTCRGIDATWTGAVDVSKDGYLYVDDLVRDRQHSLSPTRMEETYQEYLNKMVDRKNDGAKELMVGTLWNVLDPLERIRKQFQGDPRYIFRRIPALDDNDESNFDYEINGFSTQYYREMRERLDNAEWMAKYQQQPFVREGLLFASDTLRYCNGIIQDETRRVIATCDPAFGGGDSLSCPICLETLNGSKYIIGWVHNKGTQKTTIPLLVSKIVEHHITLIQLERNNGGKLFAENLQKALAERNIFFCKVVTRSAPNKMAKEDKISGYSDYIKDNFIFLMPVKSLDLDKDVLAYKRDAEYQQAMDELTMYTAEGKNTHDDAPDAITQLAMFYEVATNGQVKAIQNPFMALGGQ